MGNLHGVPPLIAQVRAGLNRSSCPTVPTDYIDEFGEPEIAEALVWKVYEPGVPEDTYDWRSPSSSINFRRPARAKLFAQMEIR